MASKRSIDRKSAHKHLEAIGARVQDRAYPLLSLADVEAFQRCYEDDAPSTYEEILETFDADPETLTDALVPLLMAQRQIGRVEPQIVDGTLEWCGGLPFGERHVHYGDLIVNGDLSYDNWLFIVGDLTVSGVITAREGGSPLYVTGNVVARGANLSAWGSSLIAGQSVDIDDAIALCVSLLAGASIRTKLLLEIDPDGAWEISDNLSADLRMGGAELAEALESQTGPLHELLRPALLSFDPKSELIAQFQLVEGLFRAIAGGESFWR